MVLNWALTFHVVAFGFLIFSGRIIPPSPPAVDELLVSADTQIVEGYVWESARAKDTILVDVYVDYGWLARVPANLYREELDLKGYGDGNHGFRYELPKWVRDGAPHLVDVRVVGTNRLIKGSNHPVNSQQETPPPAH